jgi:glycosyltransferase involved in cell wall biosynthesis
MTGAPLKVLSVIPSMARNTGGPAFSLVQSTLAMRADVQRSIYCTDAAQPAGSPGFSRLHPGSLPAGAENLDIRVFPTRRPYSFGYSPSLFRAIGERVRQVDLVTIHSLNLFPQLSAYIHAKRTNTPYIVTPHGSLGPWLRPNSRKRKAVVDFLWQRSMLNNATAIQFTTADEAALVQTVAQTAPRYVIPNGIRVDEFRDLPDGRPFRDRFLDGHSGPIVLFLGRIAKVKGIDILLSAFARAGDADSAMLVIVGPDDEGLVPSLQSQAASEGTSRRVRFLGPLYDDDRLAALGAADILALTSHTENFGNAVLEAMAASLPIIVSEAVNTSPEIHEATAGIVTSLDIDEVAAHMRQLIADPSRRELLGGRALAFAERYDWSQVAPRIIAMYRAVVEASR